MPMKLDPSKRQFFPINDRLPLEVRERLKEHGYMTHCGSGQVRAYRPHLGNWHLKEDLAVVAVYSGVKRPPRKGEWYLSGSSIAAYLAPNDLRSSYHIADLVVVKTVTHTNRDVLETL